MLLGAVEGGGTKMVLAVLDESLKILTRKTLPTREPEETTDEIISFFKDSRIDKLGIASFGPVDLNRESETYGSITCTPKLAWRYFPILPTIQRALGNIPCGFDTDVDASALAEARLGAAKDVSDSLYLTVGTGIGGGSITGGRLTHGMIHPEWGHIPLTPSKDDPAPEGFCPSHKSCAEALASGPSMEKRWGMKGRDIPKDHPAWRLEAHYIAQICLCALYATSPKRILIGGGVTGNKELFPMIREEFGKMQNGYLKSAEMNDLDTFIMPPALYPDSGLLGAALLALEAGA